MKILFIIPARGGSKGIANKNIRKLVDKPLINYTLDAAFPFLDQHELLVSTDSPEIKTIVENYGVQVPFLRPAELATDEATTESVVLHAINYYQTRNKKFDLVVVLQPTSPLRTYDHIVEALKVYDDSLDMVVSVCESKSNPYYNLFEEDPSGYLAKSKAGSFTRRQDAPKVYEYNGAIYIIKIESFLRKGMKGLSPIKKFVMLEKYAIDIDTEIDWMICESLLRK